jgi:hypothetical protein
MPTLYQNLPAEVLATMPDELKAPKSSGSAQSEISINVRLTLHLTFNSKSLAQKA